MAIAKGLGGGYLPLGATVYHRSVLDVIAQHGGPLTGHTFSAHTAACAAGAAVQRIVKRDRLVERISSEGEAFMGLVRGALAPIEAVGDIRGRGFFVGVEFVADRSSKQPFDASIQLSARINSHALARGLLCYAVSGNVDGVNGDAILLAPPYISTRAQLTEIAQLVADCAKAALQDIGRA
jgi:adenosylmethionine-8-amino-7-oxononanoate aminotransferase